MVATSETIGKIYESAFRVPKKRIICLGQPRNDVFYENSLKSASEFNIPLVIIDKEYYFKKALHESSVIGDNIKNRIYELYMSSSPLDREKLFCLVMRGETDFSNMQQTNAEDPKECKYSQ